MQRYDIKIVEGEIVDNSLSDNKPWRLSLSVKDNTSQTERSFVISDFKEKPKFNVRDVKTPEYIDSTFSKTFKKHFGAYHKINSDAIETSFERAEALRQLGKETEADEITRNIALSLYWQTEHDKFVKQSEAHFEGVDFEYFMAADYAQIKNDLSVTPNDIVKSMQYLEVPAIQEMSLSYIEECVKNVEDKISTITPTTEKYRIKGEKNTAQYTPEREKLHIQILEKLIYDNLEKYIPEEGENPTFILLGGRGGSGKSKFKNLVYDDHFIVLDADKIKEMLPEYKGWNAAEVHEESSDILEQAMLVCQKNGLNVVVDATMDTGLSAVRRLQLFKDKGYNTEAHYMFLPPQKSAQRAISRFLTGGETGRYVPIDVLLSMRNNERNFDIIKDHVDAWSFYTGDVNFGESPLLLAASKQNSGYMEKRKSKYLFDISDRNVADSFHQSEGLKLLDERIKNKINQIRVERNDRTN